MRRQNFSQKMMHHYLPGKNLIILYSFHVGQYRRGLRFLEKNFAFTPANAVLHSVEVAIEIKFPFWFRPGQANSSEGVNERICQPENQPALSDRGARPARGLSVGVQLPRHPVQLQHRWGLHRVRIRPPAGTQSAHQDRRLVRCGHPPGFQRRSPLAQKIT